MSIRDGVCLRDADPRMIKIVVAIEPASPDDAHERGVRPDRHRRRSAAQWTESANVVTADYRCGRASGVTGCESPSGHDRPARNSDWFAGLTQYLPDLRVAMAGASTQPSGPAGFGPRWRRRCLPRVLRHLPSGAFSLPLRFQSRRTSGQRSGKRPGPPKLPVRRHRWGSPDRIGTRGLPAPGGDFRQ